MRIDNLVILALALVLFSSIAGGVHAFRVEQETLLLLREQYQAAFTAAAGNDMQTARDAMQKAQQQNFRYVRLIDAHTHYIKLAVLLLLMAFLLLVCPGNSKARMWISGAMIAGIALFPTSVYLQTHKPGLVFQAGAAVGALLIIAAMTFIVVSLFQERSEQ